MTYSEFVFVILVIHQARRMWSLLPHNIFPHYINNGNIYGGGDIEYKMCVLIFSANLSASFLILRKTERDMMQNVYWSSRKVRGFLVILQLNLTFVDRFSCNIQM